MSIPFARPSITEKEISAVVDVLKSGWLTQGPKVKEFEQAFAEHVGAKHAIAVDSCTSALFLAANYCFGDLKYGKQTLLVEVPSLTFTASASILVHFGFEPFFVDVDKDSLIAKHYHFPAKIAVHLTGVKSNVEDSSRVIYDSAHLIEKDQCKDLKGTTCFSFYPTKNLASAEGGMICTNDDEAAKWLKLARNHGQTKDGYDRYAVGGMNHWRYSIEFPGWKMNMTDIQAAIGLEQLKRLPEMEAKRQSIVDRYNKAFGMTKTGLHLYPYLVENREKFLSYMTDKGINCSVHFLPLHQMPAYKRYQHVEDMSVTEHLGEHLVSLPLFVDMTDEEVDYVIEAVLNYK